MTITTNSPAIAWRTLSGDELAASPDARLGGALAVMFWAAIAMIVTVVLALVVMVTLGDFFSVAMLSQMMFSGSTLASRIARIQMIPKAMFAAWAFTFVIMTLARRPSTPRVASVLMVIWSVSSIGAAVATRYLAATGNFDILNMASLLPYVFLQVAIVSALWGYMNDGRRPNVYFRKRVRT